MVGIRPRKVDFEFPVTRPHFIFWPSLEFIIVIFQKIPMKTGYICKKNYEYPFIFCGKIKIKTYILLSTLQTLCNILLNLIWAKHPSSSEWAVNNNTFYMRVRHIMKGRKIMNNEKVTSLVFRNYVTGNSKLTVRGLMKEMTLISHNGSVNYKFPQL